MSTETKAVQHTKGPWELSTFTKPDGEPIATNHDVAETCAFSAMHSQIAELWGVTTSERDEEGRAVVICYTGNGPARESNARLIAAAPDMLEALKEIAAHSLEFDVDEIRYIASAAIRKAEGR